MDGSIRKLGYFSLILLILSLSVLSLDYLFIVLNKDASTLLYFKDITVEEKV